MPWAKLSEPSLGLALLKTVLAACGIDGEVRHFNIELLRHLKASSYTAIADVNALNEFLFTHPLEPDVSAAQLIALHDAASGLLERPTEFAARGYTPADVIDYFLTLRNHVMPRYLDECVDYVASRDATMVGLTCMYDQTFASIALATRLKARLPGVLVVLGGYALEGPCGLEILKCFDCIDAVVFGDGEPAMRGLALASVSQMDLREIPNVAFRVDGRTEQTRRVRIEMRESPEPSFTDFFRDITELETRDAVRIVPGVLPVETSRGCWWGQKSHCVFCGIDEETLKYRQRPPEQVLELVESVASKYPGETLRIVDYILPHTYFTSVLPALAAKSERPRLTCEVKANLTSAKLALMRSAGFVAVQPGIESFSTPVLRRMRKGVTGIQNVLTLKAGKENGLKIDWNLLYGFPGDDVEDYRELVRILPHLYHLDPPFSCGGVWVTRFAPLQSEPQVFQLTPPTRHRMYDVLLSPDYATTHRLDLDKLCYFFETQWRHSDELTGLFDIIDGQVNHWKEAATAHPGLRLCHVVCGDRVEFTDHRQLRSDPSVRRYPLESAPLYRLVHDEIVTLSDIPTRVPSLRRAQAYDLIESLIADRLVFREGDRVVGLSIDAQIARERADGPSAMTCSA